MLPSIAEVKGVLFDVDDTLYEEMTFVRSGFAAVARKLHRLFGWNADNLVREMLVLLSRNGRGTIFDDVLHRRKTHDVDLVKKLVSVYRGHRPEIQLFPDVALVLATLRRTGYKLGLVTDGNRDVQLRKIQSLGLLELVDVAIRTDELGADYWKPHPKPFELALTELGLEPQQTIYVGNDVTKDFQGPRGLGMGAFHIERFVEDVGRCQGCLAHWHGHDLYEVMDLLRA